MEQASPLLVIQEVVFPKGNRAHLAAPSLGISPSEFLKALRAETPECLLLLIGGVEGVDESLRARLLQLCSRGIARAVGARVAASIISFPLLTAFFYLIGIIGGYLSGVLLLGTNGGTYFYRLQSSLDVVDVRGGFIKALVFAVIVSSICCFQGYFCLMRIGGYGAKTVGLAPISAVVLSCVMILTADYVVTSFLM